MAIILLISIAKGVQRDVTEQVTDLGVNLLVVVPFRIAEGSMFAPNVAGLSYLRLVDVERVRRVPGVRRAAPVTFVGGSIRAGERQSPTTFIVAAGADWFNVRPTGYSEGRAYSLAEEDEPVVVLGGIARERLFGSESAVGKEVIVNGKPYRVVGVTRDESSEGSIFSMGSFENFAFIPFQRFATDMPDPQLHRIMVQT
ncbi:MAG TPA: ABC transporter permease, partial [Fimbriimonadaceae bacterium]|nr:ABC transporter permease [Fimbriimonadaceae bacterium]